MASPLAPEAVIANLRATALTARCHNALFRQKQLKSLHDAIRLAKLDLKEALIRDTHVSEEDAIFEIAHSLEIIKEHHEAIDARKELSQEYRICRSMNAADKRQPWGVIYIEPQKRHTPFFSVISPLSAAIVAGNCVALKTENSLCILPALLRNLLTNALESDTFWVVTSTPSLESLSSCVQTYTETHINHPSHYQIVSPQSTAVAIVDRTANFQLAAEQLVTARFAFGGTSPYAPDIVFVNEFIKQGFLKEVLKQSLQFLANTSSDSRSAKTSQERGQSSHVAKALHAISDNKMWSTKIVSQGDNGAIIDLKNLAILPPKLTQPILAISSITSLEHAISIIDQDPNVHGTLIAAYHFGFPEVGKYLSQFITANASFVNHIPKHLLLGPAAPSFHTLDIEKRYTTEHFTYPSPAFVTPLPSRSRASKLITAADSRKAAAELLAVASQEIDEKKRAESIAIGYFEQGIFVGLGFYGVPLLSFIGASLFFGVRAGLRMWGK